MLEPVSYRSEAVLSGGARPFEGLPQRAVTAEATRHHDSAHSPWAITDASGAPVLSGSDVAQLDGDGRITRLTGFFDA